ncbi:hypothetical protein, partial [Streptococcus agalactiae]|uniref:hypothetical protein n=1 Tax=Streptococcus agalactiae TaxID=1311 RepID=UPI001F54FF6D
SHTIFLFLNIYFIKLVSLSGLAMLKFVVAVARELEAAVFILVSDLHGDRRFPRQGFTCERNLLVDNRSLSLLHQGP